MKRISKLIITCIFLLGLSSLIPQYLISQNKQVTTEKLLDIQNISEALMDTPHWGNGIDCSSCHVTHNSPDAQLVNTEGNANLCMSCHNPAGMASAKPFAEADKAIPGISGTSHAWGVPAENSAHGAQAPTNPKMSARIMEGNIVCSTCHDEHSQTYTPFLRDSNYQNALCKDCHNVRDVGSYRDSTAYRGSHPVGLVYPTADSRFYSTPQDTNLILVDSGRLECTSCHGLHYTDSEGANSGQGDGYILRIANDNTLCESCHTYPGHEGMDCRTCHRPHNPNRTNIFMIRDTLQTPSSGAREVFFTAETGDSSFADGDAVYDGICEVCHTNTKYHRNNSSGNHNHNASDNCMSCHNHKDSFEHGGSGSGCISCHGHNAGYEYAPGLFCSGDGTAETHSTHTENDADDLKGPFITCDACHDTSDYPNFKSGTDANADGVFDLSETDVCNNCHSPGGSYDGVNDAQIGAKQNWSDGIYNGYELQSGKEKWCAGCHDEIPANSMVDNSGIPAPNVIGDEANDAIYGVGWGFYKTGHGVPSNEFYPASGNVTVGAGLNCEDCHDLSLSHIDHNARTFECSGGCDPSNYQESYRLKMVDGQYPMQIPLLGGTGNGTANYRLCYSCHDSGPFTNSGNMNTNLITDGVNRHEYHLRRNRLRYPADYDYSASYNSRMTCVVCHNVHGSKRLAMVRTGELIDREPGLDIWYNNDDVVSYVSSSPDPPDPENLPLSASTGTLWRPGTSSNICSHCHGSLSIYKEYRDPYQNVDQVPELDWTGENNYINDGVDPDNGTSASTFHFRIKYTDYNNNAPAPIQVWIDRNDDGDYNDSGERINMAEVNSGDNSIYDGKLYYADVALLKAGDNILNYRFYATDGSEATGEPVNDRTVTITNNFPVLSWTGETYFTVDGVNPDVGGNGAAFEFRIEYTDADNEAPVSIQLWVDENDNGTYEANERYNMSAADAGDNDYSDGKLYRLSHTLVYAGDGNLNYRFYAADAEDDALGEPINDNTVTVLMSSNTPPVLDWESTACRPQGVRPARGANDAEYEFLVKYTDLDNDFPALNGIQVWVDENDNGSYESSERYNLTEEDAGDTDCRDGKLYSASLLLAYAGDGILNYRFYANDGNDQAAGDPVSGSSVTVINALKVRPSGGSGWYSTIQAAINASSDGSTIIVYDGTYNEDVVLSGTHNRTIYSACGADATVISGNSSAVRLSFSDNVVLDGFSLSDADYGVYTNAGSTFTIENCKVYNNGEGLYFSNGTNPVIIKGCEVYDNTIRGIRTNGSNIWAEIRSCEIYSNSGTVTGSAIYLNYGTHVIDSCLIRDNTNSGDGGAIIFNGCDSTTIVSNTIFRNNRSTGGRGGAMYFGNFANPVLDKCTIEGNNAQSGGAIYVNSSADPLFKNCFITDNTADVGGAIFVNSVGLNLINCTVAGNTTSGDGGAIYFNNGTLNIRNSIFWDNSASGLGNNIRKSNTAATAVHITDSDISTSSYWIYNGDPSWDYQDNIDPAQDPLFIGNGDYHIRSGSAVIDQANAAYAPEDDIDGDSRPQGPADDMGADEYVP